VRPDWRFTPSDIDGPSRPASGCDPSPVPSMVPDAVGSTRPDAESYTRKMLQNSYLIDVTGRLQTANWRPEPESNRRLKAAKPLRSAAPRRLMAPICGPRPQWLAAGDAHRFICSAAARIAGRRLVGELLSGHARSIRWMAYHWAQGVAVPPFRSSPEGQEVVDSCRAGFMPDRLKVAIRSVHEPAAYTDSE